MNIKNHSSLNHKALILLCMLLSICTLTCSPFALAASAEKTDSLLPSGTPKDEIGDEIEKFFKENESTSAGMATSVFDDKDIIYEGYFGYANKAEKTEIDEETVIEWGSVSKLLVWVSAMQLSERGELDLNEDIREYLPAGFLKNLKYDKPITMINLMNHTAGFGSMDMYIETSDKSGIMELGYYLGKYQPSQMSEPGTIMAYSNWGAALAGYVVECISGMPYYEYVHKNIFEPLGMEHSAIYSDLSDNYAVAQKRLELSCYNPDGVTLASDGMVYINAYPAGMCTSTLSDLTTFARALLNPETVLFEKKETYEEMITPTYYIGDSEYALNCHGFWANRSSETAVEHSGATSGCMSRLIVDPANNIGMVVLVNQIRSGKYTNDMPKLVFGDYSFDYSDSYSGYVTISEDISGLDSLKLYEVFSYVNIKDYACSRTEVNGIKKIADVYGEYLVLDDSYVMGRYAIVGIWIAFMIFGIISLIVKLIRLIIRKIKRTENDIPLGVWSALSSGLDVMPLVIILPTLEYASATGNLTGCYMAQWILFFVLLIADVVFLAAGAVKLFKIYMSKKRLVYNIFAELSLVYGVFSILFWGLYKFWLL